MSQDVKTKAKIKLEKDMIFKCDLGEMTKNMGEMSLKDCYIDETNQDEVDKWGPNPSRLLGMALLGCLSASFIFCLKKRNFSLEDLVAEAEVIIGRNQKGFLRVRTINVTIDAKIDDEETRKRADQCRKMFENYCTVTAAVREGIEVNVDLRY
ncbi:MAG: OsmC family protein [Promethearchaeota archaeon]